MTEISGLFSNSPVRSRQAVVFCVDERYLPFAAHAACQIATLHPQRDFDICLVLPETIHLPASLLPYGLRRIPLGPDDPFEGFKCDNRRSTAMYHRLLLPDLLADDYDRILYLDADIHVEHGDFAALLCADLAGRPFAAVRDNPQWRTPQRHARDLKALGCENTRYFNSGVLLIDVPHWRAARLLPRAIDFGMRHHDRLMRHDQTVLNAVAAGDWAEISPVWNWQYSRRAQLFEAMVSANVIHFIGPVKPWNAPAGQLPPRFGKTLSRFMAAHFPDRPVKVPSGPAPLHLNEMLIRHYLSRSRMARYLDRFPTETTVIP